MRLVVGLGNPGDDYLNNRHNTGFMVVDKLAEKLEVGWEKGSKFNSLVAIKDSIILAKPQTYMNSSGKAVSQLTTFYKITPEDLFVIHDDLDIPLGEYKIQLGIGPKVHNGVSSINDKLGHKNYWRVRVGVDARPKDNRTLGEKYVLEDFLPEEKKILDEVITKIILDLKSRL
jgi:PTH1 family peptidyl-tRNA hydrolase